MLFMMFFSFSYAAMSGFQTFCEHVTLRNSFFLYVCSAVENF